MFLQISSELLTQNLQITIHEILIIFRVRSPRRVVFLAFRILNGRANCVCFTTVLSDPNRSIVIPNG